jgi:hypothetical protein
VNTINPANLYYQARLYDAAGNFIMGGNYVVTGASFNLGAAVPTNITTSNISFTNIVSTSVANTWTALKTFVAAIAVTPLTNQIILGTAPNQTVLNFPAPAGNITLVFPITADTMVGRATTDTLTNKTLTTPVINGASTGTGIQGTDSKLQTAGTIAGVGAALCTDANGGTTTSGCPTSLIGGGPFARTTTINNSSIVVGASTSVMSTSVTIPSSGGPYRILASYSLFCTSAAALNGADAWVNDGGANSWAFAEFFQNAGQNGSVPTLNMAELSPVTYAAGAGTITVTLLAQDNSPASSLTAVSAARVGPGVSHLSLEVIASN